VVGQSGKRSAYRVLLRHPEDKYLENPSVDRYKRIKFKRIK
jgi:hypothetical protein